MKRIVVLGLAIAGLWMASTVEGYAQRRDRDDRDDRDHRKEYNKDRHYKDRDKDRKEYYKDLRKADKEYHKDRYKAHKKYRKVASRHHVPSWGNRHNYHGDRHVYFKEYKTYYDPRREGYVYLDGGRWLFSPSVPKFMLNVDLGRAQIQIMQDIPLTVRPEVYYRR
ncbi:hypothetical protein [Myroides guanonis]|nr:hypothetical protein [Myroides guanonis]